MREAPKRVIYKQKIDHYAVGEKIRRRREELKLSQDDLADMLGSSRKMVSLYENGAREMGINTFIQYCDALSIPPEELFPERFQTHERASKAERIGALAADLSDEDRDMLLRMALRLGKK